MANDVIKTLIAEALGEGPEGMRRVAETILNRAAVRGLTPEQVVRQRAQYTGLKSPGPAARKAWQDPEAISAAQAAWELAQRPGDPTGGADHYHTDQVSPYWAKSMPRTGTYGDHIFYASRPIPPGDLPNAVGTALDVVPPAPPVPATASPDLRLLRDPPPLPRNRPQEQSAPVRAARSLASAGDSLAMSPVMGGGPSPMFDGYYDPRVDAVMKNTPQPNYGMGVNRSAPPMPVGVAQSYAGQERSPMAVQPARIVGPVPAMPSAQLAGRRATDPLLQAALNARHPASLPPLPPPSNSGIGKPPATRAVAVSEVSLPPMPVPRPNTTRIVATIPTTAPAPAPRSVQQMKEIYAGGGPTRPRVPLPTAAQIAAATPFRSGQSISDRLPKGQAGLPGLYGGGVAGVGTRAVAPIPAVRPQTPRVAQGPVAPVPMPASARPYAVASELDVQAAPPLPIPRPGTGGPEGLPQIAPMPRPRLERPGIFGRPQIFGRDVPLPGLLGGIQNLTAAAANASGPFRNGYDNLLFGAMNRGRFVSPETNPVSRPTGQTFRGTSSANRTYEAGRLYQGGRDTYRANPDGSFTNTRTGVISVGSSGSSGDRGHGSKSPGGTHSYDRTTGTWV